MHHIPRADGKLRHTPTTVRLQPGAVIDASGSLGIEARFADCARQIEQRQATEIVSDYSQHIMRCFGPVMSDMILNELETRLSRAMRG